PDGETLYWKESVAQPDEAEPGSFLVRGFSLTDKATRFAYGAGGAGCQVLTPSAGLGAVGDKAIVFDYGPELGGAPGEEVVGEPAYGVKVLTFGPEGSGCPVPVAKFKANGIEGNIEVDKGDTVSFDASSSQLASGPAPQKPGFRRELIWKFGDGSEKVVKGEG